jgi:hypothetical protein
MDGWMDRWMDGWMDRLYRGPHVWCQRLLLLSKFAQFENGSAVPSDSSLVLKAPQSLAFLLVEKKLAPQSSGIFAR